MKKRTTLCLAIIAVLLVIVPVGVSVYRETKYNNAIREFYNNGDSGAVLALENQLPDRYSELDKALHFIEIRNNFDEEDEDNYSSTIKQLQGISFTNEMLDDLYNGFYSHVSNLLDAYEEDLSHAKLLDESIKKLGNGNANQITLQEDSNLTYITQTYNKSNQRTRELVTEKRSLDIANKRMIVLKQEYLNQNLATLDNVTLEQKDKVSYLEALYNDLSDEDKAVVANTNKLFQAEQHITDLEAAQVIIDRINETKPTSLSVRPDLQQIQDDYNNLSDGAKQCVTNYNVLQQGLNDLEIAENLREKIDKIYAGSLTQSEINEIQNSYNSLSDDAKQAVPNYDEFEDEKDNFESLRKSTGDTESYDVSGYSTYYWVGSGSVYHVSKDCPTLSRSKNIHSGGKPAGRHACKVCS